MQRLLYLVCLFLSLSAIKAQNQSKNIKITIEKLGLEMTLSEKFSPVNLEDEIKKLNPKSEKYNFQEFKIEDFGKTEIFKIDNNNLFAISYDSYDYSKNDYSEMVREKNEEAFQLYKNVFPNAIIESDTTSEVIDDVSFIKYSQKVTISARKTIYHVSYYKLFQNKIDLVLALSFDGTNYGEEMMDIVRKSKIKLKN